jgi:hypothetical protein
MPDPTGPTLVRGLVQVGAESPQALVDGVVQEGRAKSPILVVIQRRTRWPDAAKRLVFRYEKHIWLHSYLYQFAIIRRRLQVGCNDSTGASTFFRGAWLVSCALADPECVGQTQQERSFARSQLTRKVVALRQPNDHNED